MHASPMLHEGQDLLRELRTALPELPFDVDAGAMARRLGIRILPDPVVRRLPIRQRSRPAGRRWLIAGLVLGSLALIAVRLVTMQRVAERDDDRWLSDEIAAVDREALTRADAGGMGAAGTPMEDL